MIKWIYPYEFFVGKIYNRNIYNTISEQTMFSRTRICHKTPNPKQYDSSVSCALERVILFLNSLSLHLFSDKSNLYLYIYIYCLCPQLRPSPSSRHCILRIISNSYNLQIRSFSNIVPAIVEVEAKC